MGATVHRPSSISAPSGRNPSPRPSSCVSCVAVKKMRTRNARPYEYGATPRPVHRPSSISA
ncbi:MAG: hypothetical protein RSB39_10000, partial [Oscillospiraceae bacterium]